MKVAAIIQVRMHSRGYPGKILDDICGRPFLYHIIERVRHSKCIDVIVVATTRKVEDREILRRAKEYNVVRFGPRIHDALKRCIAAAQLVEADVVVNVPVDSPLFEPMYIDQCVSKLALEKADFCYVNGAPPGTGVDVVTIEALQRIDAEADEPDYRDKISSFIIENPNRFKICTVDVDERLKVKGMDLTVRLKKNMKLIRPIYERLYKEGSIVSLGRAISFIKSKSKYMRMAKVDIEALKKEAEEEKAEGEEEEVRDLPGEEK